MNAYSALADLVVVLHAAYALFLVVGLVLILAGMLFRWRWTRNFWFRVVHLVMIAVVVFEAAAGLVCPLTSLEWQLRRAAGETVEEGAFIARWAHELLFIEAAPWAFTVAYCLFGAAVLATWVFAPPRWPKIKCPRIQIPNDSERIPKR